MSAQPRSDHPQPAATLCGCPSIPKVRVQKRHVARNTRTNKEVLNHHDKKVLNHHAHPSKQLSSTTRNKVCSLCSANYRGQITSPAFDWLADSAADKIPSRHDSPECSENWNSARVVPSWREIQICGPHFKRQGCPVSLHRSAGRIARVSTIHISMYSPIHYNDRWGGAVCFLSASICTMTHRL